MSTFKTKELNFRRKMCHEVLPKKREETTKDVSNKKARVMKIRRSSSFKDLFVKEVNNYCTSFDKFNNIFNSYEFTKDNIINSSFIYNFKLLKEKDQKRLCDFIKLKLNEFIIENKNVDMFYVEIRDKKYLKIGSDVVKVGNCFYKTTSRLVKKTFDGSFCLTKNAIEINDGKFADENEDVLREFLLNGKKYLYAVKENNRDISSIDQDKLVFIPYLRQTYSKDDNSIINISNDYYKNEWFLKKDTVLFYNEKYSTKNSIGYKLNVKECYISKRIFHIKDLLYCGRHFFDKKEMFINKFDSNKIKLFSVYHKGEYFSLEKNELELKHDDFVFVKEIDSYMLSLDTHQIELFSKNKISSSRIAKNISELNNGHWNSLDFTKTEPLANKILYEQGDIKGGVVYYKPEDFFKKQHFSQSLSKTGGIGYTFGIEHESCVGQLPVGICRNHGLSIIGDGSTRFSHRNRVVHYEYVSSVMHGNIGINNIYSYMSKMSKELIQNEKCSTHIHIGGVDNGNLKTDIPYFNRVFSCYAILLGSQIEESLAKLLPESRNPIKNRYCGTIKEFKDVELNTKQDMDKLIASFVFNSSSLGKTNNTKTKLSKWTESRYKWLNIVNCNSDNSRNRENSFSTIEFRIFPPSLDPEKVHFWILICLAFVWFVENNQMLILKGNNTIESVLEKAYKGSSVYNFINKSIKNSKELWY